MKLLRLNEIIKEKEINSKVLAEKVDVSPNTISRIANGGSFPSGDLLVKIAEVLDVDIRELFIPTKEATKEAVYVLRDGNYINVGSINFEP